MNGNLLTIDNMLAGVNNTPHTQPWHDTGAREKPVSSFADDKPIQTNYVRAETTDNIAPYSGRADFERPTGEFRQVLRERIKNEGPEKNSNNTEPKEQTRISDPSKTPDAVRIWLAENAVPVFQSKESVAFKLEPKAGRELSQFINSLKTEKTSPVTGDAAKSAQIKLALLAGEKGQLGLNTVLPEKSNGQNGLKMVSADIPMIMPVGKIRREPSQNNEKIILRNETAADMKVLANKEQGKELTSETSAGFGGKADESGKKAANITADLKPTALKTPTTSTTKDMVPDAAAGNGEKKTTSDGKKTSVQAELAAIQAGLAEKQSIPATSSPVKSAANAQANTAAGDRQAPSKSSDRNGREPGLNRNEPSNISASGRLNVSEVHVSADQPKEQSRSTNQKSPSGGFEQILSHGPGQNPATQQTASAANTKPANVPGQNSTNNPAADVGKQILDSIHSSIIQQKGDQQITVRLNPPELGKVFIRLQERDAELTGLLEVSRSQTRAEIEHALPQIIRNLADSGIQVKRLDVVLTDQGRSGQEAFGGQSPQNNGPYEHDSANHQPWSNEPNVHQAGEWSAGNSSYQNVSQWQQTFVTDGSINMLI